MTLPWHWLGLNGQWRRVAHFDYADPVIAWWGPWVVVSLIGGVLLVVSALLFVWNLAQLHEKPTPGRRCGGAGRAMPCRCIRSSRVPAALNGFALWNVLVLVLMIVAYGLADRSVRGVSVAGRRDPPGRRHGISGHERQRRYRRYARGGSGAALRSPRSWLSRSCSAFVVIPIVQGSAAGIDPFTAICRAIGIAPGSPARPTPSSEAPPYPVTRVSWTDATLGRAVPGDGARTASALAQERCIACHTVEGNTPDPTIPRNAGQSRFAIYKQLHDYKSGARVSDVMTPLVTDLSDKQIADLAAFYGKLVRGAIDPERAFPPYVGIEIENLVTKGDVARGLPPCISCHGIGAGGPIETPTITGQYAQYLEAQLLAFGKWPASQRHLSSHAQHRLAADPGRDEDAGDLLFRPLISGRRAEVRGDRGNAAAARDSR